MKNPPDTTVTIRAATQADLPAVLALYAQPDMDRGQVLPLAQAEAVFARFARHPDYTLYIAEENGAAVGTFALLIMPNLGHMGTPSGVVEDVVVAPSHQSRGIGRRMMAFAQRVCAEKGCYKMALSSNLKRERAHQFYESLGFTQHGLSFVVTPVATPAPQGHAA
ncbi:MAG: GNAT family N-acetyltransferase [Pseudomonadota bacterium]